MKGPFSQMNKPKRDPLDAVDRSMTRLEELEEQEAKERKTVREAKTDKIAAVLAQPVYAVDYSWPFLRDTRGGQDRRLSVSLFFPKIKAAVDKFYSMQDFKDGQVELKRRLLNANGVRYTFLHPERKLAEAEVDLEEQAKVGAP